MKLSFIPYSRNTTQVLTELSNITRTDVITVEDNHINIELQVPQSNPYIPEGVEIESSIERLGMPELEIINNEVVYSVEGLLSNLSINTLEEGNPFSQQLKLLEGLDPSFEESSSITQLGIDEEYVIEPLSVGNVGNSELPPQLIDYSLSSTQSFYTSLIDAIVQGAGAGLHTTVIGSAALICFVGGAHYVLRKIKKNSSSSQYTGLNPELGGNSGIVPDINPKPTRTFGRALVYAGTAIQLFVFLSKLGS